MFINMEIEEGTKFPFQTSRVNPETKVTTWDEPDTEAYIVLRPMGPFYEEQLLKKKKVSEIVPNTFTRGMERISYYKESSFEEAVTERDEAYDYAIIELGNFKNSKTGEILKSTKENKVKAMKQPAFDRFVKKCFEALENAGVSAKRESDLN